MFYMMSIVNHRFSLKQEPLVKVTTAKPNTRLIRGNVLLWAHGSPMKFNVIGCRLHILLFHLKVLYTLWNWLVCHYQRHWQTAHYLCVYHQTIGKCHQHTFPLPKTAECLSEDFKNTSLLNEHNGDQSSTVSEECKPWWMSYIMHWIV